MPLWVVFTETYLRYATIRKSNYKTLELDLVSLFIEYLEQELGEPSGLLGNHFKNTTVLQQIKDDLLMWKKDLDCIYFIRTAKEPLEHLNKLAGDFYNRICDMTDYALIPHGLTSTDHNVGEEQVCIGIVTVNASTKMLEWLQINPGSEYHPTMQTPWGKKNATLLHMQGIDKQFLTQEWLKLLMGLKSLIIPGGSTGYYKNVSLYECLFAQLNAEKAILVDNEASFMSFHHDSPYHVWQVISQTIRCLLTHHLHLKKDRNPVYYTLLLGFKYFLMEKTFLNFKKEKKCQCEQQVALLHTMSRVIAKWAIEHGKKENINAVSHLIRKVKMLLLKHANKNSEMCAEKSTFSKLSIASLDFIAPKISSHLKSNEEKKEKKIITSPLFPLFLNEMNLVDRAKFFDETFVKIIERSETLSDVVLLNKGLEDFFLTQLVENNYSLLEKPDENDYLLLAAIIPYIRKFSGNYQKCQCYLAHYASQNSTYNPKYVANNIIIQFLVYAVLISANRQDKLIGSLIFSNTFSTTITVDSNKLSFSDFSHQMPLEDPRWQELSVKLRNFFSRDQLAHQNQSLLFDDDFSIKISNDSNNSSNLIRCALQLFENYKPDKYKSFSKNIQQAHEENLNQYWQELLKENSEYLPPLFFDLMNGAFIARASLMGLMRYQMCRWVEPIIRWSWNNNSRYIYHREKYIYWECTGKCLINGIDVSFDNSTLKYYLINDLGYILYDKSKKYQQRLIFEKKQDSSFPVTHCTENQLIAIQHLCAGKINPLDYVLLGSIQSQAILKIERLYIAIKANRLDFGNEADVALAKQTLFEGSEQLMSVVKTNVTLINGILTSCLQQALDKRLSFTQHEAVGGILAVVTPLLRYYTTDFYREKQQFLEKLDELHEVLIRRVMDKTQPLQPITKLYLCAYAIISAQHKKQFNEQSMSHLLSTLAIIAHGAVGNIDLPQFWMIRIHEAICELQLTIDRYLTDNQSVLNAVVKMVLPSLPWPVSSMWTKPTKDCVFQCGDYSIQPLLGKLFFQGNSVVGLPNEILNHSLYENYFGKKNYLVMPVSVPYEEKEFPGYQSISEKPSFSIACINDALILIEWISNEPHYLLPDSVIRDEKKYPDMLKKMPNSNERLWHWQVKNEIIIKTSSRQPLYCWNLETNRLSVLAEKGFLVLWSQIEKNGSLLHIEHIDNQHWIAAIASEENNSNAVDQSIHYLRFGLDFFVKDGFYFSRQIHGYFLSEKQYLNTLSGFSQYLVLEAEHTQGINVQKKVLIPHYTITCQGDFFDTVIYGCYNGKKPAYFVYDVDERMGLLKTKSVTENLYLVLLYLRTGSLDNGNMAHCQDFLLANQYLENCWQTNPYSEVELSIFEQLLTTDENKSQLPDYQCITLRALAFLQKNESLHFLFDSDESTEKSQSLLKKIKKDRCWSDLFRIYLCHRSSISKRLWLTHEEEQVLFSCLSDKTLDMQQIYYFKYAISRQPQMLSSKNEKIINEIYCNMFSEEKLSTTNFKILFEKYFQANNDQRKFVVRNQCSLNFSGTILGILKERFRIEQLLTLYKMAKQKTNTSSKLRYSYFLHHMVLRSKSVLRDELPLELLMLLSRTLLLINEHKNNFKELPSWCNRINGEFNLTERVFNKDIALTDFPSPSYPSSATWKECKTIDKENTAENNRIWELFQQYDLDLNSQPNNLNYTLFDYLRWESHIYCNNSKKSKLRSHYLRLVQNNLLYNFFNDVMQQCDKLKYNTPLAHRASLLTLPTVSFSLLPEEDEKKDETITLKLTPSQTEPLVEVSDYFNIEQQHTEQLLYPLADDLQEKKGGYHTDYHRDLMSSWNEYEKTESLVYVEKDSTALHRLRDDLDRTYYLCQQSSDACWQKIEVLLAHSLSREDTQRNFLKHHSGTLLHYSKVDVLRLLVEPNLLKQYQPMADMLQDSIYNEISNYISYEIRCDHIKRSLLLLAVYENCSSEITKKALLIKLLVCLQEQLNKKAFETPYQLLFQLEYNLLIRSSQQELLEALLNDSKNSLYQLNMGEGKSSVILPLLCHALAKKKSLLHIVVLEPLFSTMHDLMYQRLHGMLNKQIYTLPFFRDTNIDEVNLDTILSLIERCQQEEGIILLTPEHQMCLELKKREVLLEYQSQHAATNRFNWKTYRTRSLCNSRGYQEIATNDGQGLLIQQDKFLRDFLIRERYIDCNDVILKTPLRGYRAYPFADIRNSMKDAGFHELSCLKAAYLELIANSMEAYTSNHKILEKLKAIMAFPVIKILDESDEILRHATELNYTMGDKQVFSGGANRWKIPELLITEFIADSKLARLLEKGQETGLTEVKSGHVKEGGVPFVRLLDEAYFDEKIQPIIVDLFFKYSLIEDALRKYKMTPDTSVTIRQTIKLRDYVLGALSIQHEKVVLEYLKDKVLLRDKLLIARGWLSFGLLFHVFNMKYRVKYGLTTQRTTHQKAVSVPFVAKDTPTLRSEFGYPDVMIGATLLSYLYEGLTLKQLCNSLSHLRNHYSTLIADKKLLGWFSECTDYPQVLTHFKNLDLSDESCRQKLHLHLSKSLKAIFYYLNHFVFPNDGYQYLYKISSNAHNLVGFAPTIGFSGTDDRKITLPYPVTSVRTNSQRSANGKLLQVLTASRNRRYLTVDCDTSEQLLNRFCEYVNQQDNCQILIDAGALVTGLTNRQVAGYLLEHLDKKFQGIVFFSETTQRLTVLMHQEKVVLLTDCHLNKKSLFSYLDDAHTRGTDLKLPLNTHGILTIGIGMEKDKLMQASMRLRQLAEHQSLSFWGTQKVTNAIRRDVINANENIDSSTLLKWVCLNTVKHINNDILAVALRMLNFQFLQYAESIVQEAPVFMPRLCGYCKESELFRLTDFYGLSPQQEDLADYLYCFANNKIKQFWKDLCEDADALKITYPQFFERIVDRNKKEKFREVIHGICNKMTPYLQTGKVSLELNNDQEKQVAVEIIQEKNTIELIPPKKPANQRDWDYLQVSKEDFILWGLERGTFCLASTIALYVKNISLTQLHWHPHFYMTYNYLKTIENPKDLNYYLRPVDMILLYREKNESYFILLSGYEAACLKRLGQLSDNYLLIHLDDINGLTQQPPNQKVSKKEQKTITAIKLFAGHCHYKDKLSLANRVGRVYPDHFHKVFTEEKAKGYFEQLIKEDFLTYNGTLTSKTLGLLAFEDKESALKQLKNEIKPLVEYDAEQIWNVLSKICNSLIFDSRASLITQHSILWKWTAMRGQETEYQGSILEEVLGDNEVRSEPL